MQHPESRRRPRRLSRYERPSTEPSGVTGQVGPCSWARDLAGHRRRRYGAAARMKPIALLCVLALFYAAGCENAPPDCGSGARRITTIRTNRKGVVPRASQHRKRHRPPAGLRPDRAPPRPRPEHRQAPPRSPPRRRREERPQPPCSSTSHGRPSAGRVTARAGTAMVRKVPW